MSNATESSHSSGERRRRRSRGGRNRNRNNNNPNQNRSQDRQQERHQGFEGDKRGGQGRSRQRTRGGKPQSVQLSWWQKLLKAIGLYKQPTRQERPPVEKIDREQRAERSERSDRSERAPKSNTRNAKTSDGAQAGGGQGGRNQGRGQRRGGDPSTVESTRVYVGNLSYEVTEQDLQELFKGVGNVRRVEIVYNRNTHRSKGYGFVDMIHKDDAIRAVEVLHDQPFMGRNMIVSGAKSKEHEEDQEETTDVATIKASDIPLAPLPEPAAASAAAEIQPEPSSEEEKPA